MGRRKMSWLLSRVLGGGLIFTITGISNNSEKSSVKVVVTTAIFLIATLNARTKALHELMGATNSCTQSQYGMEALVGRDGIG
ncbi:hypothetical protein AYI68_g5654 [Smittium mucronatum]|uniref:Uncharacterized protein n=1 Tax=Smittium mucronatum TaxID=133383 RepID=A0A1R0GTM4_9FUNG|nr:hypothetical protein AYI68_g5654 [Smittium mucronatum]